MDFALYHPECGYYARAAQRSGRAGDFFTSVDVGPLFGELLAKQIGEMAVLLDHRDHRNHRDHRDQSESGTRKVALVEAGAGNGRLAADILVALEHHHRLVYDR